MINPNWVIVAALLQLFGSWPYFLGTLRGTVKPNRVSWLLWTIAPLVAFAAEITQGVGIQSLTTFVVGFVPLVIFIASFVNKDAEWKLSGFDIFCGVLSALGLLMWYFTKVGNVAIIFSIAADGLAAVPTILKSYRFPETEDHTLYFFGVINAVVGLLAIHEWNFEHFGFPLYLLVVNTILVVLIKFRVGKKPGN